MKSTILMAIILALIPASFACGQFVLDSPPKPGQWAMFEANTPVEVLVRINDANDV